MRDKIVTAVLGDDLYVKTSHVFQYDYGLTLMIEGIQLPAEYEIHFSNKKRGVAKKGELVEGGAKIPDEYLRSGDNVYAWVYIRHGDDDGYTIYSIEIPVVQRSVEQGDNIDIIEHNIIDKTIEELEEAVAKSEENVTHYPYIDTETHHWMVYDANQKTFVDTGIDAEGEIADVIDDTSGAGVTDKAWSADKLTSELDLKAPKANPEFTGSISLGRSENTTIGNGSFAVGNNVEASGNYSHAEGMGTASGSMSHAEGAGTATGMTSHAEGMGVANGSFSHAEGTGTANGNTSHAEGMGTASNDFAHAEGTGTASGMASHAEGSGTTASGNNSHAGGFGTIANSLSQNTFGEYNVIDPGFSTASSRGTYVEIVGNGTGNNARSNARTLDWNGNEELAGDLTINKGSADEVSVSELAEDVGDLKNAVSQKADASNVPTIKLTTEDETILDISDIQGNVAVRLKDGHIQTKKFDSKTIPVNCNTDASSDTFDITDSSGNVLIRFEEGNIQTKWFDSSKTIESLSVAKARGENALSINNIFLGCYIYHHMNVEANNPYIPSESLYDIRYAKSLGFDMIEANTQKCSDGVFVVKHGANSGGIGKGIKDAVGTADYSNVKWTEVSSAWIRQNIRYNAVLPKYCGYIPTLDEFCEECRRFGMKVKVSSIEAAKVARKYLPDEMIWATMWNFGEGRDGFRGTVEIVWSASSSVDYMIDLAKTIGPPLNIVVSGRLSSRDESDVKELVKKAHDNGFTVGIVYPDPSEIMLGISLGVDCAGSTFRTVNIFNNGLDKHITELSDNALTLSSGAVYDSTTDTISMNSGSTVSCSSDFQCGKGSIILRYSGTLTITIGATGADYELQNWESDGESYVFLANVLQRKTTGNWANWFVITASENTVIYELAFDGEHV